MGKIVNQDAGFHVVVDRIDGDDNIQAFEIRPEGAGHSDMDDSIHSERLNQSIGADCGIDLSDAAADKNNRFSLQSAAGKGTAR